MLQLGLFYYQILALALQKMIHETMRTLYYKLYITRKRKKLDILFFVSKHLKNKLILSQYDHQYNHQYNH